MNVYLTFDVEVWCNDWTQLDARFPASFDRYVYGRSVRGSYALPQTLEILGRHGLRGVFFVEPLFSARFGAQYLATIVGLIRAAGQDVQLHLHPEWTDEIRPPLLADVSRKRQHLIHYSADEQTQLVAFGKRALETAGAGLVDAFRAGSYAVDAGTYLALARNGIAIDSSLNETAAISGADLLAPSSYSTARQVGSVSAFPVTVFRDGLGRLRPAQIGACSFAELRDALASAHNLGCQHFVIVSHNFEMLKPGRSDPDNTVVRRFERLCQLLASRSADYRVGPFVHEVKTSCRESRPSVQAWSTGLRLAEQAMRRLTERV